MIRGFKYPTKTCPECGAKMKSNWIKTHLIFYHRFIYTQQSPDFPIKREESQ